MTLAELSALGGLFLSAFGAATLLPFPSEVVFAALQLREAAPLWLLVAVASLGNTLGAVVNWIIGLFLERFMETRWFPVSPRQLARAQGWFQRWGVWTLLLSWAPYGDAFTLVAGIMRTPFWLFLALVALAKTGRYVALAWLLS